MMPLNHWFATFLLPDWEASWEGWHEIVNASCSFCCSSLMLIHFLRKKPSKTDSQPSPTCWKMMMMKDKNGILLKFRSFSLIFFFFVCKIWIILPLLVLKGPNTEKNLNILVILLRDYKDIGYCVFYDNRRFFKSCVVSWIVTCFCTFASKTTELNVLLWFRGENLWIHLSSDKKLDIFNRSFLWVQIEWDT